MIKASVVIPSFNCALYIKETIYSVLNQSLKNIECIVVDDGSTDNTLAVLGEIDDERIRVIPLAANGRPSIPRNVGVKNSRGKYIFIFDSDDVMEETKLERCVALMDKYSEVGFVFTDFSVIDLDGRVVLDGHMSKYNDFHEILTNLDDKSYLLNRELVSKYLIKANFVGTSSVAFRSCDYCKQDLFDETLTSGDDLLAWVKLSTVLQFAYLDMACHRYRVRSDSISNKNQERLIQNKLVVLDKISDFIPEYHKDISDKEGEYVRSLSYLYKSKRDYYKALKVHFRKRGLLSKSIAFFKLVDIFINKVFKYKG